MVCPKCNSNKISSHSFDGLWAKCDDCGYISNTEDFTSDEEIIESKEKTENRK